MRNTGLPGAAEAGEHPRLVGSVTKRIGKYSWGERAPGITAVVTNGGDHLQTQTTADGQFEFRVIAPGKRKLGVVSDHLLNDPDYFKPDFESNIPSEGCADRWLSVIADGHISGTVTDALGEPVPEVRVQTFNFATDHELDTRACTHSSSADCV
jgi:hypothetical protein